MAEGLNTTTALNLRGPVSGRKSTGVFSEKPNGTAIVFVHGFAGSPDGTWPDFPSMLPSDASARGADSFYFGYESIVTQPDVSARQLRLFLNALSRNPSSCWPNAIADERRSGFRYGQFILVAHSLGAVVSRLALHNALKAAPAPPWAHKIKLVLFAPAHKGAYRKKFLDLLGLTLMSLTHFGDLFQISERLVKKLVPAAEHLHPESDLLQELERDALHFQREMGIESVVAKRVVFGSWEFIVVQNRFGDDPPAKILHHETHTSVCKPRPTKDAPLKHVTEFL